MKNIMLVEDDEYIGNMLAEALDAQGYRTTRAYSGTEAVLLLERAKPDLILLDLMLPGLSGEEVLAKTDGIPVIVVSAKTDVDNKVKLLLDGAADYMTKPFEIKELMARIKIQLRNENASGRHRVLSAGNLTLDMVSHEVRAEGVSVNLTKTEFAILKQLIINAKGVVSKSAILDSISEDTPDCRQAPDFGTCFN